MTLQDLLTEVKIKKEKLFLTLRDYGSFYCDWNHIFPTRMLSEQRQEEIKKEIQADPNLSKYELREFKKRDGKAFNTTSIYCPINEKDNLPKEFLHGEYTWQARRKFSPAYAWVEFDEAIPKIFEQKQKLEQKLEDLYAEITESLSPKYKQAYITRHINEIEELIQGQKQYHGSLVSKNLTNAIYAERIRIQKEINDFNKNNPARVEFDQKNKKLDLVFDSHEYFLHKRMFSYEDLKDAKWCFLDIEIPLFRTENPEISWVGVEIYEKGKTNKKIFSLYDLDEKIKGYEMIKCDSESHLLDTLVDFLKQEDPIVYAPFNAPFDLIKLREVSKSFYVGERESNPKKDVSQKFFERIKLDGKIVFDLLYDAKKAYRHLPNQKLETISKFELGEQEFEKSITYDELEELEYKAKQGDIEAIISASDYVSEDVTVLPRLMFETESGKERMQDYCWLSNEFKIELTNLVHSANTINEKQDEIYFRFVGIPRKQVYLRLTSMIELDQRAKVFFGKYKQELLGNPINPGIHKDVIKAYIPVGDFLRDEVIVNFKEAKPFFDYKYQFLGNDRRQFFLSQFADALASFMVIDYGILKMEEKKLKKIEKDFNVPYWKTNHYYHKFHRHLKEKNWKVALNFRNGNLSQKKLEEYLDDYTREFVEEFNLRDDDESIKPLHQLFVQKAKVNKKWNKIRGNYRIEPEDLEAKLDTKFKKILKFVEDNDLEIIFSEANYIYLKGDADKVKNSKAPFILVDQLPSCYVNEKKKNIFYQKLGYLYHFKTKETPTPHLNVFEMRTYGTFLNNLLEDNYIESLDQLNKELIKLRQRQISTNELIWYAKASDKYSIFEHGEKIVFQTDPRYFNDEELAQGYRIEESGKKKKKETKIYFKRFDELNPDYDLYEAKALKMTHNFLDQIVQKENVDMFFTGEELTQEDFQRMLKQI